MAHRHTRKLRKSKFKNPWQQNRRGNETRALKGATNSMREQWYRAMV